MIITVKVAVPSDLHDRQKKMGSVTFNFISKRPDGEYCLYLVEEPPVAGEFIERLRAIQDRLYEAAEAVIQGKVGELYPDSIGRRIHIRLSCFDLPREPLDEFFTRFTKIMRTHEEWRDPSAAIEFEISHDTIQKNADPVGTDKPAISEARHNWGSGGVRN